MDYMETIDGIGLYNLLDSAAKAGGIEFTHCHPQPMVIWSRNAHGVASHITPWNPLISNADAMDLLDRMMDIAGSINLTLNFEHYSDLCDGKFTHKKRFVCSVPWSYRTKNWSKTPIDFSGVCVARADTGQEATRKAITMLGYCLGEKMKRDTPDKS